MGGYLPEVWRPLRYKATGPDLKRSEPAYRFAHWALRFQVAGF